MPENPIDRWLDQAVAGIHGARCRRMVRRELEDHIGDRVRLLKENRGLCEDEAVREALARMGDAQETAALISAARHPLKRFFYCLLTLLLWAAVVYLIIHLALCLGA